VRIHQRAELVADVGKYVVRISLCYLLDPLHLGVILLLLYRRRIYYLVVLLLQVFQYVADIAGCALDVFVKFTTGLDCGDGSIGSSK
jgi:hypothetical protein